MKHIEELLVVEGKHDEARLKKLFDCDVLTTNGLGFGEDTLEIIRQASENRGVIVLTDPDHPGQKIRDAIIQKAPKCRHAFIERKDAIGKRNVGVEYCDEGKLMKALESVVTFGEGHREITAAQYESLGLSGDRAKREYVSSQLHLGKCNNKRLRKYLSMLDIDLETVRKIADSYERESDRLPK